MNPPLTSTPTTVVPPPAAPPVSAINGADQYAQLKSAVLGAQANPSSASPLGNFPELAKLYSFGANANASKLAGAGGEYNTGVQAANDKAAEAEARAAAAQKLKDLQDPSKYQQVQKPDGGYAFYAPDGTEISAHEYAAIKNTTPADVLKHSQNPIDIAYRNDFNQLQNYINDKRNSGSSQKAADAAQATEDKVLETTGIDLKNYNPAQLIQEFQQAYPTVYGGTGKGRQTFVPAPIPQRASAPIPLRR